MPGKNFWVRRLLCMAVVCISAAAVATAEQPLMIAWNKQLSTERGYGYSVAVNNNGCVYTTSYSFVPDMANFTTALTKFNASGEELWRRYFDPELRTRGRHVAIDAEGNAYVAGTMFVASEAGTAQPDAFLAKFDTNGNQLWSRHFGTQGQDRFGAMAVDPEGNCFFTADLDQDVETLNTGPYRLHLFKFSPNGDQVWVKDVHSSPAETQFAATVDSFGHVFIVYHIPVEIETTHRLEKFDADGNTLWGVSIRGGTGNPSCWIDTDSLGNLYILGNLRSPEDWDPRIASLAKLTPAGEILWHKPVEKAVLDHGYHLAVNAEGDTYITSINERYGALYLSKYDTHGTALWFTPLKTDKWYGGSAVAVAPMSKVYSIGTTKDHFRAFGSERPFLLKFDAVGRPGDINGDGTVDPDDFAILKANFGRSSATRSEGDLDGDGDVDLEDFVILKSNFGAGQ